MHLPQEEEEEVQVSSEEEAEKDLVEEEETILEKDKAYSVNIVTSLVILKRIVMQHCEIWNIKVAIQLLKK
jgi:hypothetical protein